MRADDFRARLETTAELYRDLATGPVADQVIAVGEAVVTAEREGGGVYLFGNGGSAADSQHIAAEMVGRFAFDRPPMRAIALTTDTSALTAIANDYGYDQVFARQLAAFVGPRDVVIGLSTSGGSPNVIAALDVARAAGATTVALTGADAGRCGDLADHSIAVPSGTTARIQEAHIAIGHFLAEYVEAVLHADRKL